MSPRADPLVMIRTFDLAGEFRSAFMSCAPRRFDHNAPSHGVLAGVNTAVAFRVRADEVIE